MNQYTLQKKYVKKFKNFFLFFLILFFFLKNTSVVFSDIVIKGNKNISTSTIKSLSPPNLEITDLQSINDYQKKLFSSGFFSSVDIKVDKNNIYINVEENPMVNFFYIEGKLKKEMISNFEKMISIRENNIFQLYLIKDDLKKISSYLRSLGFLNSKVEYELIKLEDNKINVFYKIELNKQFKINRIFFIGDKVFKSKNLKNAISSEEHGWWKFLSNMTTVSENLVNSDISKLKFFYLNEGYYDVQITSHSIKIIDDTKADLIYSITAGDRYFFDKFSVENKTTFLIEKQKNFEKFYLNFTNQPYSPKKISGILKSFEDYFLYENLDLNISYLTKKGNSNKIFTKFIITEDKNKKRINKIIITGNNITEDFVIRNYVKFSEGDFYNKNKFVKNIDRMQGSPIFDKVSFKETYINDNELDLLINVNEKASGEISAGAGAGSEGAVIVGSIKENNFLGKGLILNSNLNIGTQKIFGNISYSDPDFMQTGNKLTNTFFIENNKFNNAAYENKLIGLSTSTQYEIYETIFFRPGFGLDSDSVDVDSTASSALQKRKGDYLTSKLFYSLDKNTKNRNFNPTDGYNIGIGQNLSFLFSDIPFLKNEFYGSYYKSFDNNFIGSVRYSFQSINGFSDDIKFSDRLYVSSNNLRGFENRGIGPVMSREFVGGNYSYYTTFSSTFPNGLPDSWNATTNVFYDLANVWGSDDSDIQDSSKIRSSIGLGFSWNSPLGPISFTYAEPITKASTDKVEQFNFKIGTAF